MNIDLDLHPALEAVAEEVGGDGVEHVDLERPEGHRLLVVVVPRAPQPPRLGMTQRSTLQASI